MDLVKAKRIVFEVIGLWNVFDGLIGIQMFQYQPFWDQVPRVIRSLLGIVLLLLA